MAAVALVAPAAAHASLITPSSDAAALANAMSAQPGLVTGASFPALSGAANPSSPSAAGIATGFVGRFLPDDGKSFAALTSGDVGLADPPNDSSDAGANNGTSSRGVNDVVQLQVDVNVPAGMNCLSFDGAFYSEEYPEYVGTQFNDGFIADLDHDTWSYSGNQVTAPDNFAFDDQHHLITVNSANFQADTDTGLQYDGSTKLLTAATPVTPGAHTIYLTIFDAGDHIYDSAMFLDNLRASNTSDCASGAALTDTDGDGLPDKWETNGYDANGDGIVDVDLPAMGASPTHKDVFVQLNAMKGLQLDNAALALVQKAFQNAPVSNPDGTTGVNLHVDNGPASVMNPVTGQTWGALSKAKEDIAFQSQLGTMNNGNYDWGAYDTIKKATFPSERWPVFRYALSASQYGNTTSSGIARGIPSSDFLVTLGPWCSPVGSCPGSTINQAGTFMHEMGHTLGLHHGGQVDTNHVPNYLSIMNYSFQLVGVSGAKTVVDYSRFGPSDLPTLNEDSLDEQTGFSPAQPSALAGYSSLVHCTLVPGQTYWQVVPIVGGVDFNCNQKIDDGTFGTDANNENGDNDAFASFNDWSSLKFKGGAIGGNGLDALLPDASVADEAPHDTLQETADALVPPPDVATGDAGATSDSATLNATANPHGSAAQVSFQYGTSTDYGQQTAGQDAGSGSADVPASATVSGLAPSTTYHYQAVVRTDAHLNYGADKTFTTAAAQAAPSPSPSPSPAPGPSPKPAAAHITLTKKALVDAKGRLLITVACAKSGPACAGVVTITTGTGKKAKTGARGTFSLKPGKAVTLKLRPSAALRRALRHGAVTVTVAAKLNGGAATKFTARTKHAPAKVKPKSHKHA